MVKKGIVYMKGKTPKVLMKEWSLVLYDRDEESVIGAMKEFGRQCFEAGREEEHSQENDWLTYQNFDKYMEKLDKK